MNEIIIRVHPDGVVGALHNDDLDFGALGKLHVRRASHVEFDEERQEWVATLVNGEEVASSRYRASALTGEVEYLSRKIEDGTIEEVWR